jgi:hypothetical protein
MDGPHLSRGQQGPGKQLELRSLHVRSEGGPAPRLRGRGRDSLYRLPQIPPFYRLRIPRLSHLQGLPERTPGEMEPPLAGLGGRPLHRLWISRRIPPDLHSPADRKPHRLGCGHGGDPFGPGPHLPVGEAAGGGRGGTRPALAARVVEGPLPPPAFSSPLLSGGSSPRPSGSRTAVPCSTGRRGWGGGE